ncbi:MAG: T9SS type A sorting domain-containing protein, partial [Bacteroidales bacterium]
LTTPIRISNDGRIIGGFGWDDVNNAIVPFIVDLGEALDKGDLTPFDPPMDTTISNENIHTQMEKISIYPNPAQEVLNISGDYNQVRIFDLRGREVFYSATPCKTISLNQFKRGMYFVKFNGNTGSQTSKLIIQ